MKSFHIIFEHAKKNEQKTPHRINSLPAYKSRQPNLKSKFIVNAYSKNKYNYKRTTMK